jgi:O-antigen ligase
MPIAPLSLIFSIIKRPALLCLLVLGIMLFSQPGIQKFRLDRYAVGLLCVVAVTHFLCFKPKLRLDYLIILPMIVLILMATSAAIRNINDLQTWSLLADMLVVPLVFYLVAHIAFRNEADIRLFHLFLAAATVYLIYVSIFWLLGWKSLIWPSSLANLEGVPTDEHIIRARGPFLNPAPNGMSISIGVIILWGWLSIRRTAPVFKWALMIASFPALIATMTRSAILGFIGGLIAFFSRNMRQVVLTCISIGLIGAFLWFIIMPMITPQESYASRFGDVENIKFRLMVNRASLEVARDNLLFGCGFNQSHSVISKYMPNYKEDAWSHNSFLQALSEQGVLGLLCYLFMLAGLSRTAFRGDGNVNNGDSLTTVKHVWMGIMAIYFINAMSLTMTYQYVNSLIFAYAGIVSNQSLLQRNTR